MSFGPPRKPPQGSRLPVVRKTSSVRMTPSETTMTTVTTTSIPRSTASSTRPSSCGTSAPCSSGASGAGGRASYRATRPPPARPPPARAPPPSQRIVETTSSMIMEPSGRTIRQTERRTTVPAKSSGYGMQRSARAPQSVCPGTASSSAQPRYRPPAQVQSSGYGMQRRAPGVCPGSTGASRPSTAPRPRTTETVTSVSSMTIDPDGHETLIEREERVIQPVPTPKASRGVCPGAAAATMSRRPPPVQRRVPYPPPTRPRTTSAGGPMQRITTSTSKTVLPDGSKIEEHSTRTEKVAAPRSSGYGPCRRPAGPSSVSATSVTSTISTGAIPKTKTVTSKTSRTSVKGPKKTTVTQEVKKIVPQSLPEGRYAMSLKHAPHTKEGKLAKYSSPPGLRRKMDANMPMEVKRGIMPPEYKGIQDIRRLTAFEPYKDVVSCAMDVKHGGARGSPSYYADPYETSFLERSITPEPGSPYSPRRATSPVKKSPLGEPSPQTILEREVEERLFEAASRTPSKALKATGTRQSPAKPHIIMTDEGPVTATEQVITEKRVQRLPGTEKISRHMTGIERKGCGAIQTELDTQTIEPGSGLKRGGDTTSEIISVKSSVAIAPGGIKETTTTVIYETTKKPERIGMSPKQVEKLVEQEAIDIDKTLKLRPLDLKVISPKSYPIRKREHELKLTYASMAELEKSVVLPDPSPDQEQEEVQPEIVAGIMYTEEQGLTLDSMPTEIYDVLFPEPHGAKMIMVNSVAPAPLQDVLVPSQLPENFHEQGITAELETAATNVAHSGQGKPTGNAFSETVGEKPALKNVARRGGRRKITEVPLLSEEMPPWGVEDMQPIVEIIGAPLKSSLVVEPIAPRGEEEEEEEIPQPPEPDITIDYMLQLETPVHASRIQLRGSTRPPWFPGYYLALPDIPDLIKVEKTPENILSSAWKAVQPNFFPDESIIVI